MSPVRYGRRAALCLVAGVLAVGCSCDDDADGRPDLEVRIVDPGIDGTLLGCGDDLDRDTTDVLEYTVEVFVVLKGADPEALQVRLSLDGGDTVETRPVPASGDVLFGNFPLPLGPGLVLVAEVLDGDKVVASDRREVRAEIELDDPTCRTEPVEPSLAFRTPLDGRVFAAADDADGSLANGLQAKVIVAAEGITEGTVALQVDGEAAGEAPLAGGEADFGLVTLPIGDGDRDVRLTATVPAAGGESVRAEIVVHIDIDGCALTVRPGPTGRACDVLAADDVDPNVPGVQMELRAESNCGAVVFTVNGETSEPIPVEDGVARLEVTLDEGENTVAARATTEGGLTGQAEPFTLRVDATPPVVTLDLDAMGVNRFGLFGNEALPDGGFRATITGTVAGVEPGSEVAVAFDPPLPGGAPATATVGEDGTFTLTADITEYACGRTLTVTARDDCDNEAESPAYEVCFDPVQPAVTLVDPPSDHVIGPGDDERPEPGAENRGIQVTMTVAIDDPRPADVDYEVFVECQAPGQVWSDRFTLRGDRRRRSEADDDGRLPIVVTFGPNDAGTLNCRGAAEPSPNAAVAQPDPPRYTIVNQQPTFTIVQPAPGQCFADGSVVVGGNGSHLTGNGAVLNAILTPEGGEPGAPIPLDGQGGDVYSVAFGAPGGPEPLADGRWHLDVSGRVRGDVAVAVVPEGGVDFVVDSVAPEIALLSPEPGAVLGAEDDADGDMTNCIQTPVRVRLDDLGTRRLCYTLNGSAEICGDVDEAGEWAAEIDLLDGDNELALRSVDCAGNETRRTFTLGAEGCPPRIQIAAPADGSRVAASADLDPDAPGLQLDGRVTTGLEAGVEVVVAVITDEGEEVFGPVAVDADGAATVRVTVPLPAQPEGPFTFRLQGRQADGASSGPVARVTVLFAPPAVQLPDLGPCLGAEYVDAGVEPGFQLALTVTTERAEPGDRAVAVFACEGQAPVEVEGAVAEDGSVALAPATLPDEAECDVTVTVTDAAGQEGRAESRLRIDRVAPQIRIAYPADGSRITAVNDELRGEGADEQGIQITPRINVCGAPGQLLRVESEPPLNGGVMEVELGEDACTNVQIEQVTLPLGDLTLTAIAADACGNRGEATSNIVVDAGAAIVVNDPRDQDRVLARDDREPERAGCQIDLTGQAIGLGAGAEYVVCTDVDQGEGPAACNGQSSALGPGGCRVRGDDQAVLTCDLDLTEGQHTLTLVGIFGDRVESAPVTVLADCSVPVVSALTVVEDADGNACLHRMERANPRRRVDRADFTVRAQIEGLEDRQTVTLLYAPSGERATSARIEGGVVDFSLDLGAGSYTFYVMSSDVAGNRLPEFGDEGVVTRPIRVDVIPPQPQLLELAPADCLNASADEAAGEPGLQYTVRVTTGGELGEMLTGVLSIEGQEPAVQAAVGDQIEFPARLFAEGANALTLTVTDPCGNAGSVAGFEQLEGLDDWTRPQPVPFVVDTVAPNPVLDGLADGQELTDDDDADGDAANGFQIGATVDFDPRDGIEAGRPVEIRSNDQLVATDPAPLTVPATFDGPLPVTLTLAPGEHRLSARAADACGNVGASAPVTVTARLTGCPAQLSFAENPVVYGRGDGTLGDGTLTVPSIQGAVDVDFNPDCAGTEARLVAASDGRVVAGPVAVGVDGTVRFDDVVLPRGATDLQLTVALAGRTTGSPVQRVIVDLDVPSVSIVTPAGPDPAMIQQDNDGDPSNGLQTNVVARVTEPDVEINSARNATLEVGDQTVARRDGIGQQSPLDVSFLGVTLGDGPARLRVCVTDAGGNQGCATRDVIVDRGAPGAIDLAATIVHPRTTEVELAFAAPAEDGDVGGAVSAFEVRRADAAIQDEDGWNVATRVALFENTAEALGQGAPFQPGEQVTLSLVGDQALALHQRHFLAVRAVDDAGRLGPIAAAEVDLRLETNTFDIGPADYWPSDRFLNQRSMVAGVGDVNNDGRGDALVSGLQWNRQFFSQVSLVLSTDGPVADFQVVPLEVPQVAGAALVAFGGYAAGVGDVDADGLPDFAVVGVTADFTAGAVALYLGSGDPADLVQADAVILTPGGRLVTYVAGIGNFNQLDADGEVLFGDLAIGGDTRSADGNFINIVAGRSRAAWRAASPIDASALDAAAGVTILRVPGAGNMAAGRSIAASDANGDGRTDVMFSTGSSWGRVFMFRGGDQLPAELAHPVADGGSVQLEHLCPPDQPGSTPVWGSNILGGVDLDGAGGQDFVVGDYNLKRIVPVASDLSRLDCFNRSPQSYGAIMAFAGDVDADGTTDIIASHLDDGVPEAHVFFNDGTGRFGLGDNPSGHRTPDVTLGSPARRKLGVAGLGDIDGDGFDDFGVVIKEAGGALRAVLFH